MRWDPSWLQPGDKAGFLAGQALASITSQKTWVCQSSKDCHQASLVALSWTKALVSLFGPGPGEDLPRKRSLSRSHLQKAVGHKGRRKCMLINAGGQQKGKHQEGWKWGQMQIWKTLPLPSQENMLQRPRATETSNTPGTLLTKPWKDLCAYLVLLLSSKFLTTHMDRARNQSLNLCKF